MTFVTIARKNKSENFPNFEYFEMILRQIFP